MPTCTQCGAPAELAHRFCSHCGAALPRNELHVYVHAVEPPASDPAAVFAALRDDPRLEALWQHTPSRLGLITPGCLIVIFTGLFIGVVVQMMSMGSPSHGPPTVFLLFFLSIPTFGFLSGLGMALSALRSVERRLAIVRGASTKTMSGKHDSQTSHYVALLFEDGQKQAFACSAELAATLEHNDKGVAYLVGKNLLDFRKL